MEVSVEELGSLRRSIKVVVPKENVSKKIKAAYKKLKSSANIKGFRKGKVPQQVLEKTYGEQVNSEVSEKLIQDTYFDALEETKIDAVVHPDIKSFDYNDDGTFSYEAEVEIKPDFELQKYKGIEIEHPKVVVSDEEIENSLEMTRKEMAPLKGVEGRGVQDNDIAIIDFQGFNEEGEALPHVSGQEYSVDVGSGRNGKEFEDMLMGLKSGEEVTKKIEFPADFANQMLAGKNVEFKISVKDVKERVLAELDDEFAKDVSEDFNTLDDLKSSIAEKLKAEKEKAQEGDITDKIMLTVLDGHDFELPGRLVAYEINELVKELENNLEKQGHSLESAGLNREKLAEQYKESAERRIKGDFIIKKIAEVESIKLADEDINKGFQRISDQYGMPVDEIKKYFQSRNDMLPFMNELLNEKVLGFIKDATTINYVDPETIDSKEEGEE